MTTKTGPIPHEIMARFERDLARVMAEAEAECHRQREYEKRLRHEAQKIDPPD